MIVKPLWELNNAIRAAERNLQLFTNDYHDTLDDLETEIRRVRKAMRDDSMVALATEKLDSLTCQFFAMKESMEALAVEEYREGDPKTNRLDYGTMRLRASTTVKAESTDPLDVLHTLENLNDAGVLEVLVKSATLKINQADAKGFLKARPVAGVALKTTLKASLTVDEPPQGEDENENLPF